VERGNESRRLGDLLRRDKEQDPDEGWIGTIERADDNPGVGCQTDRALVAVKPGSAGVYVKCLSAGPDRHEKHTEQSQDSNPCCVTARRRQASLAVHNHLADAHRDTTTIREMRDVPPSGCLAARVTASVWQN